MNLFAGNLGEGNDKANAPSGNPFDEPIFSNFANFDDAFAGATPVTESDPGFDANFSAAAPETNSDPFSSSAPSSTTNGAIDDIFGGPGDHADLLIDEPPVKDTGEEVAEAVVDPVESPEADATANDGEDNIPS